MSTKPKNFKLQTTVPAHAHSWLGALADAGMYGASRSEVAAYILTSWISTNIGNIDALRAHPFTKYSDDSNNGDSDE